LRRTFIAQPKVFDQPLRLASANERRLCRLSRLTKSLGFHQEKFAFS